MKEKLKKIKLLITDVDGVLTDAGMYYSANGDFLKKFNARDGMGIRLLKNIGIETAIITGEDTDIVRKRAIKIGVTESHLGILHKLPVFKELLKNRSLKPEEVAYIGDDIGDLPIIGNVGLFFCPADAMKVIKDKADLVLTLKGGEGCLRELAEMIFEVNDKFTGYDL